MVAGDFFMHILRHLRPNGLPYIFDIIYCPKTSGVIAFREFALSEEPGEPEPRKGNVEDFTTDSLRNQIIGPAEYIDGETVQGMERLNELGFIEKDI